MIKEITQPRVHPFYLGLKVGDKITKVTVEYEPFSWIEHYEEQLKIAIENQRKCELRIKLLEVGVETEGMEGKTISELEEILAKKQKP